MALLQKQVYLIGFMGCGKSTYGQALARLLQVPFFDLDAEIEAAAGKSITQIFADYGEEYFRELESSQLKKFTNTRGKFVLATGGGTACQFKNIRLMNKNGTTIYLKLPPAVLFNRLKEQKDYRPLIRDLSNDELNFYIHKTLTARSGFYNFADVVIDPLNYTPQHLYHLNKNIKP